MLECQLNDTISFDDIAAALSTWSGCRQLRDVVPIEEWISSNYYLGDEVKTLYPFWKDVLVDFSNGNFNELILGGSLRSGKSTCAYIATIRKFYELTCFSPIPTLFNLSPTSLILFMYLSLSLTQANMLGMGRMRRMIDRIPYFREKFPRDIATDSILKFADPALVMIGGSSLGHFKGSDLYVIIFDEANFARGAEQMKFQNAVDIYRESSIRRKSTFLVDGKESGVGIIISSADTQSSFVEKHIEEVKNDTNVMIVHAIAYEVQPTRYRGIGTFAVFIGDDLIDPFIMFENFESLNNLCTIYHLLINSVDDIDKLSEEVKAKIKFVPTTFIHQFRADIYGALKEVCGVSIGQEGRFFTNRVKYNEAFPKGTEDQHPFTKKEITISYLDLEKLEHYLIERKLNLNPKFEYFGAIDQSLTTDCTGVALGHIDPKALDFNLTYDFLLRVNPPRKPGKISPAKITDFFISLFQTGSLGSLKVTQDWYASAESLQRFHINSIEAEVFSVDKTWDHYRSFAGSILDGKVHGYSYEPLREEIFHLIQNNENKKIDHPSGGSKDVADAACHVHANALQAYLDIRGGIRYFDKFGPTNIIPIQWNDKYELSAGVYFEPGPFYVCWIYLDWADMLRPTVFVLDEYSNFSGSIEQKIQDVKRKTVYYGKECKYSADPDGRTKSDNVEVAPLKAYRRAGLPMKCRKNLDRLNFDVIQSLIQDPNRQRLFINEDLCPLLISSLRKAKHKMRGGIKSGSIEIDEHLFPALALRFVLEDALSKSLVVAY